MRVLQDNLSIIYQFNSREEIHKNKRDLAITLYDEIINGHHRYVSVTFLYPRRLRDKECYVFDYHTDDRVMEYLNHGELRTCREILKSYPPLLEIANKNRNSGLIVKEVSK